MKWTLWNWAGLAVILADWMIWDFGPMELVQVVISNLIHYPVPQWPGGILLGFLYAFIAHKANEGAEIYDAGYEAITQPETVWHETPKGERT